MILDTNNHEGKRTQSNYKQELLHINSKEGRQLYVYICVYSLVPVCICVLHD